MPCRRLTIGSILLSNLLLVLFLNGSLHAANVAAPLCNRAYASPGALWPPNHRYESIGIEGVFDPDGDELDIAVRCVRQDEPPNERGDGNTAQDGWGVGLDHAYVRRERQGGGNGRVYTIDFIATDPGGRNCQGVVRVGVPKSRKRAAVDDGALFDSSSGNLDCDARIPSNEPPTAITQSLVTPRNTAIDLVLGGTDVNADALSFTVVSAPGSGTLSGTAPHLTYAPDTDFAGDDRFTFVASDGRLSSTPVAVEIEIEATNRAPLAESAALETLEDMPIALALAASDADDDPLRYEILTEPRHGTLSGVAPAMTYSPAPDFAGQDTFSFRVNDGRADSAPAEIEIAIQSVNDTPIVDDVFASTDSRTSVDVTLVGRDADGDALSYRVVSGPSSGEVLVDGATASYRPDPTFDGVATFSYVASDGDALSASATVEIVVVNPNTPPVARPQTLSVDSGAAVSIVLDGDDADDDPLTFEIVEGPRNGTLFGEPPVLRYEPLLDFTGEDTFAYAVSDGTASSEQAIVTIDVVPVNRFPEAIAQTLETAEDIALPVLLEGFDADGDPIQYSIARQPLHGELSGEGPNRVYTPDPDFHGTDSFTFIVADDGSSSAPARVSLTVTPVNDPPRFTSTPESDVLAGETYAYSPAVLDVDGDDNIRFSLKDAPTEMRLSDGDHTILWTPAFEDVGTVTIVLEARDGRDGVAVQEFELAVSPPPNSPPRITSTPLQTALSRSLYRYEPIVVDDEDDELSYTLKSGPASMTIDPVEGTLSWIPSPEDVGQQTVTLVATDGELSTEQTFDLEVLPLPSRNTLEGTEHWLAFPRPGSANEIYITGRHRTTSTVHFPTSGESKVVEVIPGETTTVAVPLREYHSAGDRVLDHGIRVESTLPTVVSTLSYSRADTDAFSVFPTSALGTSYRVMTYRANPHVLILSTEDGTEVTLTPNRLLTRRGGQLGSGEPLTITLNEGQTYKLDYFSSLVSDLTGMEIRSTKPVAVFSGNDCTDVPTGSGFCDRLLSQLTPVDLWAKSYYTTPLLSRLLGSTYRVLANEDDTVVRLDGVATRRLGAGEHVDMLIREASRISADKPILTALFSNGDTFDRDERRVAAGSAFSLLRRTPVERDHDVSIDTSTDRNFIVVVVPVGTEGQVRIDGEPVPARYFVPIERRDGWSYAQIALDEGQYHVSAPVPILVEKNIDFLNEYADPFLALIPGESGFANHHTFTVPQTKIGRHFVNIVAASDSPVVLDGVQIDSRRFQEIKGTPYSYVRLAVNVGDHTVTSTKPTGLLVYGFDRHVSYGYVGGLRTGTTPRGATVQLSSGSSAPSAGERACFAVQIVDFGSLDGPGELRLKLVSSGTHDWTETVVTDSSGSAEHCFSGYGTGSDVVSVLVDGEIAASLDIEWEVNSARNHSPEIVRLPVLYAAEGDVYRSSVLAVDPDADSLIYRIGGADVPDGLAIDRDTGELTWLEPRAGRYTLVVSVTDPDGLHAAETMTLTVNSPPLIVTEPDQEVRIGHNYFTRIVAADADGDRLLYALEEGPFDYRVDYAGNITWKKVPADLVGQEIVISVTDVHGGKAYYRYTPTVYVPNSPPRFTTSVWNYSVFVGDRLEVKIDASDADGDAIEFALRQSQPGMTMDPDTGLLSWAPTVQQVGIHEVYVGIEDSRGASTGRTVTVEVKNPNVVPVVTSFPPTKAKAGYAYLYSATATDADGDPLTYSLEAGPAGMTVDDSGIVRWSPSAARATAVTLRVSDGTGFTDQAWALDVLAADAALDAQLRISSDTVDAAEPVTLSVTPINAVEPVSIEVTVDGEPIELTPQNEAVVSRRTPGTYTVDVTVRDRYDSVTDTGRFVVRDASDSTPPLATMSNDIDGQVITEPVRLNGAVSDANLVRWTLFYTPTDARAVERVVIASGTEPVDTSRELGTLDPSLMTNGQYHVVLEAEDVNGEVSQHVETVIVDGNRKVGAFSVSFEDLSIPMNGIPLTVTRTYDSRERYRSMDFGHGWSIDYQSVRVQENRRLGDSWEMTSSGGSFPTYCVEPIGPHVVTVSLPDGSLETFDVAVSPRCRSLVPPDAVFPTFEPRPGTTSSLEDVSGYTLRVNDDQLISLDTGTAYDPTAYELTTQSGYVYHLDKGFGIRRIEDPNGHTLTYTDDGIFHSAGKSVAFARDAEGRIVEIEDPAGNLISYDYDAAGDLASVMDRGFASTDFVYDADHALTDIVDPLGRRLVKNLYDEDGRLIAQEDSDGNRTVFAHDLEGRQSVVTDRLGRTTVLVYDERGNVTSEIDPAGQITSYAYDALDNRISETNPLGETTTATFDTRGNQLTQTDALGHTVSYAYNARGQETRIVDARGNVFENAYDARGNLLTVTDPLGHVAGQNLDARGLVSRRQDAEGHVTTFAYDSEGNLVREEDAEGGVVTYAYDANNNRVEESRTRTLADGRSVVETTRYAYDARDRLVHTVDPLGSESRTEYDLAGRETTRIDAKGRRTTMTYDAYGRLTTTTYPDGTTETATYDTEGNKLSDIDRLGRTTTYRYDALDRLVETTYPDGSSTSVEYDAAGRVVAETDERGHVTRHAYDAAGRRIETVDALGHSVAYVYDADGNLVAETNARGHTTRHAYDALDRRVATTYADATTVASEYDARGLETAAIDQNGRRTEYAHDGLGRLTAVTDALGGVTGYGYDEAGNRTSQTDALGRVTRWSYDALGRETSRTLPLGQIETFAYDATGNRTRHTDFDGATHRFVYEATTDRLIEERWADGAVVEYGYDAAGRRTRARDDNGTFRYAYDERDMLLRETKADGSELRYDYDAAGNRTTLTTAVAGASRTTAFTHDALDRLATVTAPDGGKTTYSYDANGNETRVEHANGTLTTRTFDALDRITEVEHLGRGRGTLARYAYTLDATGRRTTITEASGRRTDYTYDALYRLTNEAITDATNGDHTSSYVYDAVGNRIYDTVDGMQTAYAYDDNDRLEQAGGTRYTYDERGNTTSETLDGVATTMRYDSRNRLIERAGGGGTVSLNYDPDGNRLGRTVDGETTTFLVDTNRPYAQVLHERNDSAALEYVHGRDLLSLTSEYSTYTYHVDALGSTRLLTDSAGTVADAYTYDAWGERLSGGTVFENHYLHAGEQFDPVLGDYYLRARYYGPETGRLTQMDTWAGNASDPITLNKYAYGNGDPANTIDPSGYFGLVSIGVANTIRSEISSLQIDVGMSLLDAAFDSGSAESGPNALGYGLAALGGEASFKLLRMMSGKFRAGCAVNSFAGETLVATEHGLRPIADLEIGDLVWSADLETEEIRLEELTHLISGRGDAEMVSVLLDTGERIRATPRHSLFLPDSDVWIDAVDLVEGNRLLGLDSKLHTVISVVREKDRSDVFNVTVDENHNYYVGAAAVLSHNTGGCNIDGILHGPFRKPSLTKNPKHQREGGGRKSGKSAGLEPFDSDIALQKFGVKSANGNWYARSTDGTAIYRYSSDGNIPGKTFHWSGSTGDASAPLQKNRIPAGVLRHFGIKGKGRSLK